MALTSSIMLKLGTKLTSFELINTINSEKFNSYSLSKDKGKIIMFICNHCPFVIHYHRQITDVTKQYASEIEFVAISSNDAENYPEDGPEKMREMSKKLGWDFPYLYDETQGVARKYKAACTPEFYLFDREDKLIYRGRMDDSSPRNGQEITGSDLRGAIDDFLARRELSKVQKPSMGCNIKWKN